MSEWTKAVEVVAQVIDDEGGRPGSSLHSWRCEHPDIYGECSCVAETAEEIVATLAAAGLLADPTARTEELAKAWDEGFVAGYADGTETGMTDPPNPYRTVTDWTPAEEDD